jgi:hypothetical protein
VLSLQCHNPRICSSQISPRLGDSSRVPWCARLANWFLDLRRILSLLCFASPPASRILVLAHTACGARRRYHAHGSLMKRTIGSKKTTSESHSATSGTRRDKGGLFSAIWIRGTVLIDVYVQEPRHGESLPWTLVSLLIRVRSRNGGIGQILRMTGKIPGVCTILSHLQGRPGVQRPALAAFVR